MSTQTSIRIDGRPARLEGKPFRVKLPPKGVHIDPPRARPSHSWLGVVMRVTVEAIKGVKILVGVHADTFGIGIPNKIGQKYGAGLTIMHLA